MLPFKNIFKDKNALGAFLRYRKFELKESSVKCGLMLFISAFIFINILGIVINIKVVGENFYPEFRSNVNWAWGAMWVLVAGKRLFDFIFPPKKPPKRRSKKPSKKK